MDRMELPINVIPGTNPPMFRWRQVVETPTGKQSVKCEGTLPAPVEAAVMELIKLTKTLQKRLDGALEIVAEQSKKLHPPVTDATPSQEPTKPPPPAPSAGNHPKRHK